MKVKINVKTGSSVVATCGENTYSGVSVDGVCELNIKKAGTYKVTATKDGQTTTGEIFVPYGVLEYKHTMDITAIASLTPKSGVTYTDGIADLTPDIISMFAGAISNNADITSETGIVYVDWQGYHRKISVGDQIVVDFSHGGSNYAFDVIGFNHDDLLYTNAYGKESKTGKAGMTLQMHDCYGAASYDMNDTGTNTGGWENSKGRTSVMAEMKYVLGDAWELIVQSVNKLSGLGNSSTSGVETTVDKCFLLSEVEIFGSTSHSTSGEGEQYQYYKAGNSKVKKLNGSANTWWMRSPYAGSTTKFGCVDSGGNSSGASANVNYGIAFAFCI